MMVLPTVFYLRIAFSAETGRGVEGYNIRILIYSYSRCFNDRNAVETRNIFGIVSGVFGFSFTIPILAVLVVSFNKMFQP